MLEIGVVAARVAQKVETSLSVTEVLSLAKQAMAVSPEKVRFVTLAGKGAVAKKSGASYYVISRPSAIEILKNIVGADVNEQNFDTDCLFLNENYAEFGKIYADPAEYTVYDAATLCKNGIDIAHK